MRAIFGVAGAVAALVLSSAANAGKYQCSFQNNGTAVKTCAIDSSATSSCQYQFSSTLTGVCAVGALSSAEDELACVFTRSASAPPLFTGAKPKNIKDAVKALTEQPGFAAGGVTLAATSKGVVAGVYVEAQGAPSLAGVCEP